MPLNNHMLEVLTYMEQVYYEEGTFPTEEKVAEVTRFSVDTVKGYWKDADFRSAIAARGMVVKGEDDSRALTLPQLLMANMLMNPSDRRSMREKLKDPSIAAFEVTIQQANGWLRSATYQEHLRKRARALFGGAEASAYKGLVQAIEAGDQKAIQLYFEMQGIYNPKLQIDVNISTILTRVVEIIALHVKDPATLQLIANDLDGLDIGAPARVEGDVKSPVILVEAVETVPLQFTI